MLLPPGIMPPPIMPGIIAGMPPRAFFAPRFTNVTCHTYHTNTHTHTLLQTTADTIHTADLCFMCICAWLRLLVFFWVLCAEPFRSNIPETAWNTLSVLVLFLLLAVWNRVAFSSTMKPSDLYNLFRDVFDMFDMFEFCCLFYVCFICLQLLSL